MKNSGIEWIGEIPEDWDIYRNKNAFICNKEIVGKNSNSTQLLSLTTGGIKCKDINNVEGKLPESFDTYQYVKKNDVVMCLFDLDMSAVFSGISQYDGMISPAYKVLSCQDRANPLFIHYWFSYIFDGRKFNHYAKNIRYTLNYNEFATLPILLPPKSTQQRIASYLDKKCSKIEETIQNQQQVIEKLKAYKQSLITEAVTGKVKIENGKVCGEYESYKDSGVEWIGKIPSGWEIKKAKYFIKISNGSDPKTEEGDTPVYGSGAESFKTCVEFKEGPTVLIGRKGATLHIPHYIEGNYWNVDTAFDVKTYSEEILLLKFYYYCATAFDYRFYLTSTTLPSMTQTNYGNMYLPVPNTLVQKEIVEFLDNKYNAIDTAIEQKQKLIEKLTEYKKSLIYECVTGKKEVN